MIRAATHKQSLSYTLFPLLLRYHGNQTAILSQESKVSSACLSLLNDLILSHYSGTEQNNRPEAEQSFEDRGISSYSALRKSGFIGFEIMLFSFTFSRGASVFIRDSHIFRPGVARELGVLESH